MELYELPARGLFLLSGAQLLAALVAIFVMTKVGSQLRPAVAFMNLFFIGGAVVVAAVLFALAWNK